MNFFSKITKFMKGAFTQPEDKLFILRAIVEGDELIMVSFLLLKGRAQQQVKNLSSRDLISMYIVAIAFRVLVLLGHDPTSGSFRTSDEETRINESCQMQRRRIDMTQINNEVL